MRPITVEEAGAFLDCVDAAFFNDRPPRREQPPHRDQPSLVDWWAEHVDLERAVAAFNDGRLVGTLRSFATALTVPGPAEVPASAIAAVTVAPTHRRRGLLSTMIGGELRAAAGREEPVSVLIASEWPIYGRFGYGPAVDVSDYRLDARTARFLRPSTGSVELLDLDTYCELASPLYEAARPGLVGAVERDAGWWDYRRRFTARPARGAAYHAVHRDPAGEVDGFLTYRVEPEWEAMRCNGRLLVDDLVVLTPAAYAALWRFCADVDLVVEVRATRRPVDEWLALLLGDGRCARHTDRYDFMWARVIDVPGALARRRYSAEETIVLAVDDALGFAGGTYRLETGGDGSAGCTRTAAAPDLHLAVDALGSLYLGGASAQRLAAAGRIEELRPGALERAAALFQTATAPWSPTSF